jgi:hypothetical protein
LLLHRSAIFYTFAAKFPQKTKHTMPYKFFDEQRHHIDDTIALRPNFGDEASTATALIASRLRAPILVLACDDGNYHTTIPTGLCTTTSAARPKSSNVQIRN